MNTVHPDTAPMLSGVALAGGMGSRIGGEKGLADLAGHPMLTHVLRALSHVTDDIVVAVGKGTAPEYARVLGPAVRIVEDRVPGRGPLEGLSNAMGFVEHDMVVVVPCDVPFIRPEILRLMADRADGKDGAVPVVDGYVEPLVAAYRTAAGIAAFELELDEGVGKVGNAVRSMDVRMVPEQDLRAVDNDLVSFWNVNSREDLRRAVVMARGRLTSDPFLPSTE